MSAPARNAYDDLVVGAGASGLTAAILLARQGRSVLLVDCAPAPGGALRRFRRGGAFFETGFHFTGSIRPGELFEHLLGILGLQGEVIPAAHSNDFVHKFIFANAGATVELPVGLEQTRAALQKQFPAERAALAWYFDALQSIVNRTIGMVPGQPLQAFGMLDEDFVTLRAVLDERFADPVLKGAIGAFAMCYGTPPASISFSAHARVAYGFHQSSGTFKGGGDALAEGLARAARRAGVEICCGCGLTGFSAPHEGSVRTALLANGQVVAFDRCLLTIDPAQILELLAPVRPTPAFQARVRGFSPSVGFFAAYGIVSGGAPVAGFGQTVCSIFPDTDFDRMMDPRQAGDERPLVILEEPGEPENRIPPSVTALELSFYQDVEKWAGSRLGARPAEYRAYKQARLDRIQQGLARTVGYANRVKWVDTASMLTFRDYLHSPCGSAYGIMQQVGQYGLFGRLPGGSLYAAGQSALLPGVLGAMMSGLLVVRQMAGKETFDPLFYPEAK